MTIRNEIERDNLSTGERLKRDLGLENFTFSWIQKVINSALNIYIVTVDSRFQNVYISRSKLRKISFATLKKVKNKEGSHTFNDFSLTPGIDLDDFTGKVTTNSIIMFRDLGGHYFSDEKMYECVNIQNVKKEVLKEISIITKKRYKRVFSEEN